MKSYSDTKVLKWSWLKRQSYIPCSDILGDGSKAGWKLIEKFPIESIKYNPIEYPNPLSMNQVLEMVEEFYPFGFYPIRIDSNLNLKDGQHSLKFSQLCGFKFIDVWIEEKE